MTFLLLLNYFYILLTGSLSLRSESSPRSFPFMCICSVSSNFWTDFHLSVWKMDVIQVLAGRDASVNSLFHIWVFGFWAERIWWALDVFPGPGQTQPVWLCASALVYPTLFFLISTPKCSCRACQYPHLKRGPAVTAFPSRRNWVFFSLLRTQETVKVSWKGEKLCQESANTLFLSLKQSQWFLLLCLLCHLTDRLPTDPRKYG